MALVVLALLVAALIVAVVRIRKERAVENSAERPTDHGEVASA